MAELIRSTPFRFPSTLRTLAVNVTRIVSAVPLFVSVFVTVAVPIAFYPVSYTVWAAVDLAMRPLEPAEVADAEAHSPKHP